MTCRVDHDCFLGHICLHNMCIFGCHSDEDCSASETCRDNRCSNPCQNSPCGPNAVCNVNSHRATCSCRPGLVPNPTAQVQYISLTGLICKLNPDPDLFLLLLPYRIWTSSKHCCQSQWLYYKILIYNGIRIKIEG